jgi:hypothetical protein
VKPKKKIKDTLERIQITRRKYEKKKHYHGESKVKQSKIKLKHCEKRKERKKMEGVPWRRFQDIYIVPQLSENHNKSELLLLPVQVIYAYLLYEPETETETRTPCS